MKLSLSKRSSKDNYLVLFSSIALAELAGGIGAIFTTSAIPTWYAYLNKPFFNPPNWLFGPVWTILYALMGISAYLIWRQHKFSQHAKVFWALYSVQLILNTLWSIIFFGLRWTGLAFIEIIIMWWFILQTIVEASHLHKTSAYLLMPYIFWVSFATLLNLAIFVLN